MKVRRVIPEVDFVAEAVKFREIEEELAVIAMEHDILPPGVVLVWSERFTRRMGDASVTNRPDRLGIVRLSAPLWPLATVEKRRNTMIHELAHIYAELEHWRAKHGPVWAKWMTRFGEEPRRCYTEDEVEVSKLMHKRKTRCVGYCPGCSKKIVITKHLRTRWIKHRQYRKCLECRTKLSWLWAVEMELKTL